VSTFRLFPSTSGPATATSISASYIAGVLFSVTQGGCFFDGFWLWVCQGGGQPTAATKCALWCVARGPTATGTVVPGSMVTSSGPLSSTPAGGEVGGHWNYIPLAASIPVAINTTYLAAIAINGPFPDTASQFGSGQPLSAGIVNGPLNCFSDTGGSNPEPYGNPQGIFSAFGGSDPSTTMPTSGNSSSNLWADVQVSDVPPSGGLSSRLWPNKFDAELYRPAGTDAAQDFVLAHEVHALAAVNTSWVWFYSPSPASGLPTWCGVWNISGQSIAAQNASPSWVTPDGSSAASAGGGWCKAALVASLPAGQYKVAVWNSNGTAGGWSPYNYGYWLSGGGKNGITSGPLFAPGQSGAASALIFNGSGATEPSQGTFSAAGTLHYPDTAVDYHTSGPANAIAESFWVDLEVTPAPVAGTASLSAAASLSGTGRLVIAGTAPLSGHGILAAAALRAVPGTAALSAPGSLSAAARLTARGAAALSAPGAMSAAARQVSGGSAHLASAPALTASGARSARGQGALTAAAALAAAARVARNGSASLAAVPTLAASGVVPAATASGQAALAAAGQLTAAATVGVSLGALWVAYQQAQQKSSAAWDQWHMMRQAGGTDGSAGFLFGQAYEAQRAAEAAYEAWKAAQRAAVPGVTG
jgi:hypothetical protein